MSFYRGLIIVAPHGSWIADGTKSMIIKSVPLRKIANRPLLLIESKKALGIVWLSGPRPISVLKFRQLRSKHRITDPERKKWWKYRQLYVYDVLRKKIYRKPRKINYPQGPQILVKPENIF